METWKTGLFKMPCLETPRFQTAVKVTVASGGQRYDTKTKILRSADELLILILEPKKLILEMSYKLKCFDSIYFKVVGLNQYC